MSKQVRKQVIEWGKIIYQQKLVVAREGNLSVKLDDEKIMITAANSHLGFLTDSDLLIVDYHGNIIAGDKRATSEIKMHLAIHNNLAGRIVIHAHPIFTNLFFARFSCLEHITFESSYFLNDLELLKQTSINVDDVTAVVHALRKKEITVLKNHGVVALSNHFKDGLSAIELLERQAQINIFQRLIS